MDNNFHRTAVGIRSQSLNISLRHCQAFRQVSLKDPKISNRRPQARRRSRIVS